MYAFADVRAYSFWNLRELLDPENGYNFCLPDSDDLAGDLAVLTHTITTDGLIRIESKEQIKKRIGRSTDAWDAVAIAMFTPPISRIGVHI